MSSTAAADRPGTAEDQAYFRLLEERFLALRGRATLLSGEDWETARAWRHLGVPAEVVIEVMERLFARQRERRGRRGISSLRYFRAAVEAAWHERLELGAGAARPVADAGPPVEERLAALARALPAGLPGRAALAERIAGLAGDFERVEGGLAELDRATLEELRRGLAADELAAIRARVERAVGMALAAAPPAEVAQARARLEVQALRDRFGLPLLSLFSSVALGPPPER